MIGALSLLVQNKHLHRVTLGMISLSAGTMMGNAFLHLLPEAATKLEPEPLFLTVLVSFIVFFFIEKFLHWRHCHDRDCDVHTFGEISLMGDSIHNLIDGLIIAAAFVTDIKIGIATALAVALHEIPQELGDFGVLLHAGWDKKKAILANYSVALTVVLGGILGFYLAENLDAFLIYAVPMAAGGFIYIAASDLLPEIRKETSTKRSLYSLAMFLFGIAAMWGLKFVK